MTDDLLPFIYGQDLTRPVEFDDLVFLAQLYGNESADTARNRRSAGGGLSELSLTNRKAIVRRGIVQLAFRYWSALGQNKRPGYTLSDSKNAPGHDLKEGEWGGPVTELIFEAFNFAGVPKESWGWPSRSSIKRDMYELGLMADWLTWR